MSLEEQNKSNALQTPTVASIIENKKVFSSNLHRHVIALGNNYSGDIAKVQARCPAVFFAE